MKAIAVVPGSTTVDLADRPEPQISADDEVKLRIVRVGICGTDREITSGGRAQAPAGQKDLIIGHEMLGQVVAVGKSVTRVREGDYAVFSVRRSCGTCINCAMNRSDMCTTGKYLERGIWGMDGFQCEFAVDKEQYVVRLPPELEPIGVLTEPTAVVEKAIDEVVRIQTTRLPDADVTPDWLYGRRCLVVGLGPIGLMAAMILRLRNADVYGTDVVDASSDRARWLEHIGGHYIDERQVPPDTLSETIGGIDVIVEATGVPSLEFNLINALALNGAYVMTGIPGPGKPIEVPGADLIRKMVLDNLVIVGSVNDSRAHFQMAVDDLAFAQKTWGDHIASVITHRYPPEQYQAVFGQRDPNDIKVVVEWANHT